MQQQEPQKEIGRKKIKTFTLERVPCEKVAASTASALAQVILPKISQLLREANTTDRDVRDFMDEVPDALWKMRFAQLLKDFIGEEIDKMVFNNKNYGGTTLMEALLQKEPHFSYHAALRTAYNTLSHEDLKFLKPYLVAMTRNTMDAAEIRGCDMDGLDLG